MTKRILFVDDEPMVLSGIQRSLRSMRSEWDVEVANGGADALKIMAETAFDVVVSDMRMPGMDGAQLLDQVKTKFPRTVRFVLSGQSEREAILRSIGPSHQYLSKPCDVEELKQKITHAFALRELLDNPHLKEIISSMQTVPSLPSLYVAVTDALRLPDVSIANIAKLISQDMGMTSKVLQLVNSAFFGLPCQVCDPRQAVSLLGIENIKALVLSVHVFSELKGETTEEMAFLWPHSLHTAAFAKAIAHAQGEKQNVEDEAFAAGLLHDVGRLVLASSCGPQYEKVLRMKAERKTDISEIEQEVFHCTHAEVGAYLLGLWGLPDSIVEAVAWHHSPSAAGLGAFSPVIAVHVADHFDHGTHADSTPSEHPKLDDDLLARLGLRDRVKVWLSRCQDLDQNGKGNA
jgi:HD-like signal output (HDOD) protein/CheY-like chemotaxis protein